MSKYEERLAQDKTAIRDRLVAVGRSVEAAIANSVAALLSMDREACYQIILGDLAINRELRLIDKLCHAFVARHLPSAGHLRFVSSSLKMVVELERVGDYAATISREAIHLSEAPPEPLVVHLHECADQACATLQHAMTAFSESDAKLARATKPQQRRRGGTFDQAFQGLLAEGSALQIRDLFALKTIFYKIERVSDQAKNICEETLFEILGEVKPPKRYRVLFVNARDTLVGPLAAAIASKAFPDSAICTSAGWSAGEEFAPELFELARQLGLDPGDRKPAPLPDVDELSNYDVIVALAREARRHVPEIPRKVIYLQWELPKLAGADNGDLSDRLREVAQHLSSEIRELMVALHGEGAS